MNKDYIFKTVVFLGCVMVVLCFLWAETGDLKPTIREDFIENHSEIKRDTDFIFAIYKDVDARHQATIVSGHRVQDSIDIYVKKKDRNNTDRLLKQFNFYWYPLDRRQRDTMKRLLREIGSKLIEK